MKQTNLEYKPEIEVLRKPYIKPQVLRVNLIARDAVLNVGCKTESGTVQNGAIGTSCSVPFACSTYGS